MQKTVSEKLQEKGFVFLNNEITKLEIITMHLINHFRYGCDLVFTPMIVADCFVKSVKARDMEFTTNTGNVI